MKYKTLLVVRVIVGNLILIGVKSLVAIIGPVRFMRNP